MKQKKKRTNKRTSQWRSTRSIGPTMRCAILLRDGMCCVYCGTALKVKGAQLDHVQARKDGGESKPWNLVSCCDPCNQGRRLNRIPFPSSAARQLYQPIDMASGRALAKVTYPGRFKVKGLARSNEVQEGAQ